MGVKDALKGLEEDKITDWAIKLQKSSRKNRFKELQRKGLV